MNGIDALKAKFADVELKANARSGCLYRGKLGRISCENHRE